MSRSAAAKKAWASRRRGGSVPLVRARDVRVKRVSGRIADYVSFREDMSGRLAYSSRRARGESRAQLQRRLGVAKAIPLRGGVILKRRPASVPGLSSSAKRWIDGLGFPLGENSSSAKATPPRRGSRVSPLWRGVGKGIWRGYGGGR